MLRPTFLLAGCSMPIRDVCHQQVMNALQKASWIVDESQVFLRADGLTFYVDIQAQHTNGSVQRIIVVEVKCFSDERSDQDELYRAIGQYLIYRSVLQIRAPQIPLYLAIPSLVYNRLFRKTVVQNVVENNQIKVVVVNLELEEIIQWVD
jgi:hypothetical protein